MYAVAVYVSSRRCAYISTETVRRKVEVKNSWRSRGPMYTELYIDVRIQNFLQINQMNKRARFMKYTCVLPIPTLVNNKTTLVWSQNGVTANSNKLAIATAHKKSAKSVVHSLLSPPALSISLERKRLLTCASCWHGLANDAALHGGHVLGNVLAWWHPERTGQ